MIRLIKGRLLTCSYNRKRGIIWGRGVPTESRSEPGSEPSESKKKDSDEKMIKKSQ